MESERACLGLSGRAIRVHSGPGSMIRWWWWCTPRVPIANVPPRFVLFHCLFVLPLSSCVCKCVKRTKIDPSKASHSWMENGEWSFCLPWVYIHLPFVALDDGSFCFNSNLNLPDQWTFLESKWSKKQALQEFIFLLIWLVGIQLSGYNGLEVAQNSSLSVASEQSKVRTFSVALWLNDQLF